MTSYEFHTVPHLVVRAGAAASLADILSLRFSARHACIITDPFLHQSGLLAPALASLTAAGWRADVISDVQADPPEERVLEITARARQLGCQLIIGMGGGSSMDVAKLVAVLLASEQPLSEMYGIDQVRGARLPLVQIPTTAGTGSEVTPISIVTTGATTKSGVVAPQLYADLVILDASLTLGLPPAVTAATGIDAMVHAIEAFTSRHRKNPLSDQLAISALRLLSGSLLRACACGQDLQARQDMLFGAMLAGQAFANAPVAAVHALAYPIGGIFHVPHGLSNALVLPHVLRHNSAYCGDLYAQLAAAVMPVAPQGDTAQCAQAWVRYLESLIQASALPRRLREVGVTRADIPAMAAAALLQTRLLANNPCELGLADVTAIYEQAW